MIRSIRNKWIAAVVIALVFILFLQTSVVEAAGERELRQIGGLTYVYDVEWGVPVANKWSEIGGVWYYTDATGLVYTDQFLTKGTKTYYLGPDGGMVTGFFEKDGDLYYATTDGVVRTKSGWFSPDSKWYFSNSGGTIRRNMGFWSGNKVYYAGADGALTGGIYTVSDKLRYFNEDGEGTAAGWVKVDGVWYYAETGGVIAKNKIISTGKDFYYVGESGTLEEGLFTVNDHLRYFDKNGKARAAAGWVQYKGDWYYADKSGYIVRNDGLTWKNDTYYFGEDGKLAGGVHEVSGNLRFFNEDGVAKKTAGWISYKGKWYYADKGGILRRNQALWKDVVYYFGDDGTLTGGIHEVNKALRFFDSKGEMRTAGGWLKYQGGWYYAKDGGILYRSEKVLFEGKYYYLGDDGKMVTGGLFKAGDNILHFAKSNGELETSKNLTVDGNRYYADPTGDIYAGSTFNEAQKYSSNTNYLIMVDLSEQITVLYKGSKDNWIFQREFTCSTGTKDHPTPTGEYRTTIHDLYFDSFGYRCWYATGFIGGEYLFHSSPYTLTSKPEVCADRTLGTPSSHGCVRMKLEDAKWLYDNIPLGTKVVIIK